jgi:VWFA-related protein
MHVLRTFVILAVLCVPSFTQEQIVTLPVYGEALSAGSRAEMVSIAKPKSGRVLRLDRVEVAALPFQDATKRPTVVVLDATAVVGNAGMVAQVLDLIYSATQHGELVSVFAVDAQGLRTVHNLGTPLAVVASAFKEPKIYSNLSKATRGAIDAPAKEQAPAEQVQREIAQITGLLKEIRPAGGIPGSTAQLMSLRQLARGLERIPGRKALVWVSKNFPVLIDGSIASYRGLGSTDCRGLTIQYQKAIENLNRSHLTVFSLSLTDNDVMERGGMEEFAKQTGGTLASRSHPLQTIVKDASEKLGNYYTLTVAVPYANKEVGWSPVKFTVEGGELNSPPGFFSLPAREDKD